MIKKFLSDSGLNLASQVAALGCGLASSVLTARILGAERFGTAAFILLLPLTVQALIGSGFSPTIIYMSASGQWKSSELLNRLTGLWVYLSVAMISVAFAILYFGGNWYAHIPLWLMMVSLAIIPLKLLASALTAILTSKRLFKYILLQSVVVSPLRLIAAILFVWWFDLGVPGAVLVVLFGELAAVFTGALIIRNQLNFSFASPEFRLKPLLPSLHFGFRSGMGNIVGFLNYRADQFIVKGFLGDVGLGIYSVAVGLVEKLWLLANNLGSVLLPMVSSDQSSTKQIEKFIAKTALIVFFALIASGVILAMLAEPILKIYGPDYVTSAPVLIYLLPGIILGGASKLFANYVAGKGRPELNAIRGACALVINVMLNIWLIPEMGVVGAAIATSISYGLSSLASGIIFYKMSRCTLAELFIPSKEEIRRLATRCRKIYAN